MQIKALNSHSIWQDVEGIFQEAGLGIGHLSESRRSSGECQWTGNDYTEEEKRAEEKSHSPESVLLCCTCTCTYLHNYSTFLPFCGGENVSIIDR